MELEQAIKEYEFECTKFREPVAHYLVLTVTGDQYDIMMMPRNPVVINSTELYIGLELLKSGTKDRATEIYITHTDGLKFMTMKPKCMFVKDEFRIVS